MKYAVSEQLVVLSFLVAAATASAQTQEPLRNPAHDANGESLAYPRQRGPGYDYTYYTQSQQERADAVVEQFRFAWDGYVWLLDFRVTTVC